MSWKHSEKNPIQLILWWQKDAKVDWNLFAKSLAPPSGVYQILSAFGEFLKNIDCTISFTIFTMFYQIFLSP